MPAADARNVFTSDLGAYVRERRRAAGLSQTELSELAGVGRRFVSELEQDKPTVRVDAVNRVLAVFGKVLGVVDAPRPDATAEGVR